MKSSVLALAAALAASCTAPDAGPGPTRNFSLDLPPGCSLTGPPFRYCDFVTADGRERQLVVIDSAAPFDEGFGPATLREDAERYLGRAAMSREARNAGSDGVTVRRTEVRAFAPPPGAGTCVLVVNDITFARTNVSSDRRGIWCALNDPATNVWGEFALLYREPRPPGVAPDPGFEADAERVFRTLRFAPPSA